MSLLDTASLIVTPNGYKEGTLYSVIPSDGSGDMSVVRATTATRVNSAGLVELVPYNLLTYSEQFNNADWTKYLTSITSNSTTAPNGQTTADTVTDTASGGLVIQASASVNTGTTVTFSQYCKRSNNDWIYLGISRSGATTYGEVVGFFNLATGTSGSNIPYGAGVFVSLNIENVGNGWYRCSMTAYVTNAVAYEGYSGNANTNGVPFVSSIGDEFYAWGAQLVEGTLPKDYQKTETRLNIPRLDYSNGTCPSLLVEPQRTNLLTYSSSFDNANWIKDNATITSNSNVSPSGIQDADTIASVLAVESNATQLQTIATNTTYSFSVFIKKDNNESRFPEIVLRTDGITYVEQYVQLNTKTGATNVRYQSGTVSHKVESFANYWKISLTNTGLLDVLIIARIRPAVTNVFGTYNPQIGSIVAWGAQLEAGSYPTSYIPTTSASVTRNADVVSKTGISSLIGQTEGTVFIDVDVNLSYTQSDMRFISVSDGSSDNWYFIGTNVENEFRFYYRAGATTYVTITTALTSGRHKLAFAYKSNDYVAYLDGTQVNNTTTLAVGGTSDIALGNSFGGNIGKEYINASALWKTRLTNTQLAQLTTI